MPLAVNCWVLLLFRPDFGFLIALTISTLDGLSKLTSISDGASGIDGVSVGDGLLSSSLK